MRFSAATTAERLLPERIAAAARPILVRLDSLIHASDERGEAGRISVFAFAIRIVSAVFAFISQVFLARWMGSFEYGIFVFVWVAVVIAGNIACFGFHTSVIRFVPEYRETQRFAELRGILLASRLLTFFAATAVALVASAGVYLLGDAIESYYVLPLYLGIACLPMIALSDVLSGISRANAWAISALVPVYILRPVLILVFMGGALFVGLEATAVTAVVAAILATYTTAVMQLINVRAQSDRVIPPGPRAMLWRQWIIVSLPIFLVESFFFLLTNADVLMVGMYMSPHDVAVYFATVKTLALVHFVYFAVKAGVAQRYAAYMHGDREQLDAFARETVSWTFWPSLAMAVVVLLLGKPMLMLFGPGFDAGYFLLFLLVGGVVARAAVGPAESLLTMSGHQNICALVYAVTLAINVILNMLLIPHFGLWGAAAATAFAMTFEAAALSFTVWRKLGIVMIIVSTTAKRKTAQ